MSKCRDEDGRFASCDTGGRRSRKRRGGRRAGSLSPNQIMETFFDLPRVDDVENPRYDRYTLWGDNLDELLRSGNERAYESAKDTFASAVEALRLPGVGELEVFYEGKGKWSVQVHRGSPARGRRGAGRRATSKYTATSAPMIHTPGMYKWMSRITAREVNKEARDFGAKMYMMAGLFPGLPSIVLQDVAMGNADVTVDEKAGTVTIIYDDPTKS